MGNQQSTAYNRISGIIPQTHESAWEDRNWPDKQRDRSQFINAVISLLSDNGAKSLDDTVLKLLFSRTQEDQLVATLIAMKDDVIQAKIESPMGGETRNEAFKLLKKHVEMNLHGLLQTIPDAAASSRCSGGVAFGDPSSRRSSMTTLTTSDMPPAYGESSAGDNGQVGKKM